MKKSSVLFLDRVYEKTCMTTATVAYNKRDNQYPRVKQSVGSTVHSSVHVGKLGMTLTLSRRSCVATD